MLKLGDALALAGLNDQHCILASPDMRRSRWAAVVSILGMPVRDAFGVETSKRPEMEF
jgi:hypothetical protein